MASATRSVAKISNGIFHTMPIKVAAVSKDAFKNWLVDAKKKFARRDDGSGAVRVAAVPEPADAARPDAR